jgi:Ribbon-helix-helix protein, copG family
MKTTLALDDALVMKLKGEAARRGRSMSDLVEEALHLLFRDGRAARADLPQLPSFDSGGHLVDISDRTALERALAGS